MPKPDSINANPKAKRKLAELVTSGIAYPGIRPSQIYNDPQYASIFDGINRDAIRRHLRHLFQQKSAQNVQST